MVLEYNKYILFSKNLIAYINFINIANYDNSLKVKNISFFIKNYQFI